MASSRSGLVGGEIELDLRAVGVVEEDLPDTRSHLSPADVFDATRLEGGERRGEAGGRECDVVDHAGLQLVPRSSADDVQHRLVAGVQPRAGKAESGTRTIGQAQNLAEERAPCAARRR